MLIQLDFDRPVERRQHPARHDAVARRPADRLARLGAVVALVAAF